MCGPPVLDVGCTASNKLPLHNISRGCNDAAEIVARQVQARQLVDDFLEESVQCSPTTGKVGSGELVQSVAALLHELFNERDRVGVAGRLTIVASAPIGTCCANGQKDTLMRNEVLDV